MPNFYVKFQAPLMTYLEVAVIKAVIFIRVHKRVGLSLSFLAICNLPLYAMAEVSIVWAHVIVTLTQLLRERLLTYAKIGL